MAKHITTGRLGEDLALRLLESKGYIIHALNWRYLHKEIDIIAQEGNDLVFVEVKTRRTQSFGQAIEAVDEAKRRNMIIAANHYIRSQGLSYNARFDIIAIDYSDAEHYRIEHVVNAFYPTADTSKARRRAGRLNKNRIPKQ